MIKETLIINNDNNDGLTEAEAKRLKPIITDFITTYSQNHERNPSEWLPEKIKEYLPEYSESDINNMSDSIIKSIQASDKSKKELDTAKKKGLTREVWIENEVLTATSGLSASDSAKFLTSLDTAISEANCSMHNSIMTKEGLINQGANLDGFIAEQYHAQTFNLNAKLSGSKYRAEVLEPAPGETYGKNSVDIVIKDEAGKIVKRYQSKYYQSAEETANAFEQGDYRGQQKLVPSDQIDNIEKKCTDVIEAPDGTKSNPLQKNEAKEKQIDAQNGNEQKLDWNEFDNKELAKSIGKKIGFAGIQGAAIGVGFDIAKKCFNGEKIKPEEEVKVAIETGADFGLKSALGAALKVGSEKGFLKFIPKGTSSSFLGNIAFVAVENVKVLMKAVTKKITPRETVSKMADITVSSVGGLLLLGKGVGLGSTIGTLTGTSIGLFLGGPIGALAGMKVGNAVGGFAGGAVAYKCGATVGKAVCDTVKNIAKTAINKAKQVGKKLFECGKKIVQKIKKCCKAKA